MMRQRLQNGSGNNNEKSLKHEKNPLPRHHTLAYVAFFYKICHFDDKIIYLNYLRIIFILTF